MTLPATENRWRKGDNMTREQESRWRDTHNTDKYVAEALGYDDDLWENARPEQAARVRKDAASAAHSEGADDDDTLCWGDETFRLGDWRS